MQIPISVAEADHRLHDHYGGASAPIIKMPPPTLARANTEAHWRENPRTEGTDTARHIGALGFYFDIGTLASPSLPPFQFPAVFDFLDGRRRPDKGAIKTFLVNGVIEAVNGSEESGALLFALTDLGRRRISPGTA
jgi:hypothetical protein